MVYRQSLLKSSFILICILSFGSCLFWYLQMDNHMDFQILLATSSNYPINITNHSVTELLDQINALKSTNSKLNESIGQIETEKQELITQIKQLKQFIQSDDDRRYYLLYGSCIEPPSKMDPHAAVIADSLKKYVEKHYPHWTIIDISVQSFLMRFNFTYPYNFTYSHEKLFEFTKTIIPHINMKQDRFQWIFGPHCRAYHIGLKTYYFNNVTDTETIQQPPDIYKYYNVSKSNAYGYMDDDDRIISRWDHATNINHHHFDNISLNIPNSDRVLKVWQNNSYYGEVKYPSSLNQNRPFLLGLSGEAFDAHDVRARYDCHHWDFHIQRTKSWPIKGCIVSDIIQGILQRDIEMQGVVNQSLMMDYGKLIVPNDPTSREKYVDDIVKQKTRFCSFTVKTLMMFGHYMADALVRHVVHHMLSKQYKYCDMLGPKHNAEQDEHLLCNRDNPKYKHHRITHHLLAECQKEFKFSINMENTASYGYTSEKVYTGLIAHTIPIYFGNKDVANIINKERIIFCDIDDELLVDKREEYRELTREWRQKFGKFNQNKTAGDIAQRLSFEWGLKNYGPHLQLCVDEIIKVDKNDTLYRHKLLQPVIPNNSFHNSHYDGSVVSKSIIDALEFLKSPLFDK